MGRKEFNPTIDGGKLGRPNGEEKQQLMPTLSTTDNWILLTHLLKESNKILLPFREAKLVARSEVQNSRHKGWWREGKDELATHLMSTEVWISTKGRITEDTRTTIQEDMKQMTRKILLPLERKTSRPYTVKAQRRASWASNPSQGQSTPQMDLSTEKVMGAGFYRLDENWGGCCQLGRREEGNSSNRAELGAACLVLEYAKDRKDRKPTILQSSCWTPYAS